MNTMKKITFARTWQPPPRRRCARRARRLLRISLHTPASDSGDTSPNRLTNAVPPGSRWQRAVRLRRLTSPAASRRGLPIDDLENTLHHSRHTLSSAMYIGGD
jgi:hypothetical protein